MACFHPWTAYIADGHITFTAAHGGRPLSLPCQQCIGCRLERSRQWATRCMHEAELHEQNCFVTLTYNDHALSQVKASSLNYRDFQLFMKRLRKKFPGRKIRFYMCGEYGEHFARPHFHACLFGIDFDDKEPITPGASGAKVFRSKTLELLWRHGYASVGAVTFQSAAYVARYVMKKITGDRATSHYTYITDDGEILEREPEFAHMSLKPGIGAAWYEKYKRDLYPSDQVIVNGHPTKPPRYYDTLHARTHELELERIRRKRVNKASANWQDNRPSRRKAKEAVTKARISTLKRTIK